MKKTALVTGSTRGIGRGIADALLLAGYDVVYSGRAAQRPEDVPAQARYIGCDIGDSGQRSGLIQALDRLDVLVNNAGIAPRQRLDLLQTTEESFDEVLGVNLRGTFFLCQLAANAMIAQQDRGWPGYAPRIINISSISAYTSSTGRGEYCVAKAGIAMVTQLFAHRLAERRIPVFEIRPGIIETDMTRGVWDQYQRRIDEGLLPIARFGEPKDVADAVLAACSGLLDYTTGQVLNVDGGFHLRRL